MRFEVVSPGMGSRTELERMTSTAIATLAQVRERGSQQSDGAPQRAVDGPRPGRLVEVLEPTRRRAAGVHDEQVEATEGGHARGDGRRGPVRCREVRGTASASSAAARASSRSLGRATSPTVAPSARRTVATAPPRPPLPPPPGRERPSAPGPSSSAGRRRGGGRRGRWRGLGRQRVDDDLERPDDPFRVRSGAPSGRRPATAASAPTRPRRRGRRPSHGWATASRSGPPRRRSRCRRPPPGRGGSRRRSDRAAD